VAKLLSKMSNKQCIFACLKMLKRAGNLTEENIYLLPNKDYCSTNFLCQFPILSEVPTFGEISSDYYNNKSGYR
jgi:hypothetical protein